MTALLGAPSAAVLMAVAVLAAAMLHPPWTNYVLQKMIAVKERLAQAQ